MSYVPKLGRDDGRIDWNMSAKALERRIRAYDPWPGTFALASEGGKPKRLKVFPPSSMVDMQLEPGALSIDEGKLIVGCGENSLELDTVQPEGGRRMSAADYLHGRKLERFE